MKTLECKICRVFKPEESFHRAQNVLRNGRHTRCKECSRESDKGRQRSNYDPARNWTPAAKARKRRWAKAHRDKVKCAARIAVRTAILNGRLTPPKACQSCFQSPTAVDGRRTIQAHHHAGYQSPLDVIWLCPKCHRKAESAMSAPSAKGATP